MTQSQDKNAVDPLIGREVKDYRFIDKLGGGAFGAVYRAEHVRLSGRSVAIKVLHPHIASDEGIVERFRREARSLAALNHPNIVQIIDFDWDDEVGFYLVLEWLKGDALNKILKTNKRLSVSDVIDLFSQMLSALQEAHDQGIVHRDLKPANVMVVEAGPKKVLKILDFGIASLSDSEHELTTDGTAMGSANYMSPEQALGQIRKIDNRSDLYSCGIIMGKCLTGKNVYAADSPTQILWKHIYEPPPLLKSLYPDGNFSQELEDVFAKSIAKEKDSRFQNANEFLAALRTAAEKSTNDTALVSDELTDGEETIFDASYLTGSLASMSGPSVDVNVQANMSQSGLAAVTAEPPRGEMIARGVVASQQPQPTRSLNGAQQEIGNSSAIVGQVASAVQQPQPQPQSAPQQAPQQPTRPNGGPAIARGPAVAGAQAQRQPGHHTIPTAGSGMIRSRERGEATGLGRLVRDHDNGESSGSFSSSAMRPGHESPRVRSSRRSASSAIRSPMLQPPPEPTFWEQYRWWVLGGAIFAALMIGSVVAVAIFQKPKPAVKQDKDPILDFDKLDSAVKKETKQK